MDGNTDVLIVGAGPTGLMAAAELARHGVRARVVERRLSRTTESRALAVHARTLEIFDDMGLVNAALERGTRLHGVNVWSGGKRVAHASTDDLDSPYPFILSLPQGDTEELLEECALRLGVEMERGAAVTHVEQQEEGVLVRIEHAGGREETVTPEYLLACDGAHSPVRTALGVEFEGVDLDAVFGLADVELDGDLPRDEATAFFSSSGVVVCLPMPGASRTRIVASDPEDGVDPGLEWFEKVLAERAGRALSLRDATWTTTFRVRQRKIKSYRVGRVFFAGDAAHVHSPIGGQGMNTGIQDAYNLAWKLALVCRKAGRPDLLHSYEAEREPVARKLLAATERATRAVTLRGAVSHDVKSRILRFLTSFESVQQRIAKTLGELDLDYRGSPIVQEERGSLRDVKWTPGGAPEATRFADLRDFAAAPRAGDRAPDCTFGRQGAVRQLFDVLRGTSPVLLLFAGTIATPETYRKLAGIAERAAVRFRSELAVHLVAHGGNASPDDVGTHSVLDDAEGELHRRYGARSECQYWIRPDGYIGYRSQPADFEKLEAFLSGFLY